MYSKRRQIGNVGEDIACEFLVRKGYTLIQRNYLKPYGEIDIVAAKDGIVRFVEVKAVTRESIQASGSRENLGYRPEEQVHAAKLRRLARVAAVYMEEAGDARDYQIDAVTVQMDPYSRTARCRLYEQVL